MGVALRPGTVAVAGTFGVQPFASRKKHATMARTEREKRRTPRWHRPPLRGRGFPRNRFSLLTVPILALQDAVSSEKFSRERMAASARFSQSFGTRLRHNASSYPLSGMNRPLAPCRSTPCRSLSAELASLWWTPSVVFHHVGGRGNYVPESHSPSCGYLVISQQLQRWRHCRRS